ncbi:O-antigen ligase family protein [Bradyrhizobium sp.]|uniref:O-antigen ligase family protein n=1 Tax=Bradyrhizobium sp. TaxID=376 RepID=UPI003C5A3142
MIGRLHMKFPVETLNSIQFRLTIAVLCLAPLVFGSVDQLWIAIWTVLLSVSTLCGVAAPLNGRQSRILFVFLALCLAYALVAIVQVAPRLFDQLSDPIWQRAENLLGLDAAPRISSRAEIPPIAIGHFLLLLTAFVSGFFVGTSRRKGDLLMLVAQYSILLYALYGLIALVLTPNMLLWAPKLAYRGSLTASFVNHNTAATFIGSGVILWFCSVYITLQSFRTGSLRLLLLVPSNEHVAFKVILQSAAALICFFALLLTGSRGGLICSSLGVLVAISLMIANRLQPRFWYALAGGLATLAVMAAWLSGIGRIGSQGLFDGARWSVYGLCIESIRQRPLLGAGAGTFADLFPSLRPDNFPGWGVWDFAHSTILEIAVEMGIPMAAMVLIAAVASLIILVQAALRSKDRSRSSLSAIAGIVVLTYLHATIDFSLQIPGYLIVFAILLGCGLARAAGSPVAPQYERASVRFG